MSVALNKPPAAELIQRSDELFRVSRRSFTDADVLGAERRSIFDRCWLYLAHESEIPDKGSFVLREVGGRGILFVRGKDGQPRAFLNTCPHRGAQVCRHQSGKAKTFQCFYHGWVFANTGELRSQPGADHYSENFNEGGRSNLVAVPRLDCYRDFWFVNFDAGAQSLEEYLGAACEWIDVICDQAEAKMEIVGGTQEYAINANWKLLVENSVDGYHALTTHATYIDYLLNASGSMADVPFEGIAHDLGNGHAVIEYRAPWGRPVAQWIPAWGEEGKRELTGIRERLEARCGGQRAKRIAESNRNMLIFPNLIINDIMAVTVRTFYPVRPNFMQVSAWALAPTEESPWARKYRLFNFLEFLGPGGFATPDDVEALEQCQRGYENMLEAPWNDISKGLNQAQPQYDDELQMRVFWSRWHEYVQAGLEG